MASNRQEINLLRLLFLVLGSLPLIKATNIDCNGKAFHCVNSTHFMICVDIGRGLSSTVDDFMIPCPMNTECRITNRFECEYPPISSTTTLSPTTVEVVDLTTTVNQMEANNNEYATTLSPITEINDLVNSETTEGIDRTFIGQTLKILDVIEQTLSPQMKEDYIESGIKLATTTSGENLNVFTTVTPATVITTSDITNTEPVTQIVEITNIIDDSYTHTSQYDLTSISVVSTESLKDSIVKDKDNLFVDVFTQRTSYGDIEVTTDIDFIPNDSPFAQNIDSVATTETLATEIYISTEAMNTDVMTTITMDIENTIYTTKDDIVDNSVNDSTTTVSLILSSDSDISTDNTEATTDIRTTIFGIQDISNTSPKNAATSDSNFIDSSTHLLNDINSVITTEAIVFQDSTTLSPLYTSSDITQREYGFSENVLYDTTEAAIPKDLITKGNTQVNVLVTESDILNTPNGPSISELPVAVVGGSYIEFGRHDTNDFTTEYTETLFTTNSPYTFGDDKPPQNRADDIPTKIFDAQDATLISLNSVTSIDTINTDVTESTTVFINDFNSVFTTESVTTQDSTILSTSYTLPAVKESDNVPLLIRSEDAQFEGIMTNKDDMDENLSLTEGDIFHATNSLRGTTISELPITVKYEDYTELGTDGFHDRTTQYAETLYSITSINKFNNDKSTDINDPEDISTIVIRGTNTPETFTTNLEIKPTEVLANSTSYLFMKNDNDLDHSPESSNNILSESIPNQKSNKDSVLLQEMDLLLPTIANEIESATEFLNQVEFSLINNFNTSKTLENLSLAETAEIIQNKAEGGGTVITKKQTELPSVIKLNTNIEDITKLTTSGNNFTVNSNKFNNSLSKDENSSTLIFPTQNGDASVTYIVNVNYSTSTPVTPQVPIQESLTEAVQDKLILKTPYSTSIPLATNRIEVENFIESVQSTTLSSIINEEININIDEKIIPTQSLLETERVRYDQDKKLVNVLDLTEDHTTAQTTIQSLYGYKENDIVSTENIESITIQSDIHTNIRESVNYETIKKTRLNVEKNVGTSSMKHISNSINEKDLAVEVENVVVATTVTSNQDIQIDQVQNKIPITTTESIFDYIGKSGNPVNNIYEETSTIESTLSPSSYNIDVNIPFITTTDKTNSNIEFITKVTLEYKSTDYLDRSIKTSITESEINNDIPFSSEKNNNLKANTNNTVRIGQNEIETYVTNSTYNINIFSELPTLVTEVISVVNEPNNVNLNLSTVNNSALQSDIEMTHKDAQILGHKTKNDIYNEVTTNKNIFRNIYIDSQKYISQTNTNNNDYKEVTENIDNDNVDINHVNYRISNTVTSSSKPKDVLSTSSANPIHETVIESTSKTYSESKIDNSVSNIQNITYRIDTSNDTSNQIITTSIDEKKKMSSYTISSQIITKSVDENQSMHGTKKVQSSESTTSKLFDNDQIGTINFSCLYYFRGRYADNENCRRFYICIGRPYPIIGMCPVNTVFSEFRKQCTNNLAHCVRNYVFYCTSEGRFSDIFNNNMYYICVKNNDNNFIRYKLQCENGYYLNKASIKCTPNLLLKPQTILLESNKSQKSSDISFSQTISNESRKIRKGEDFICEKEGKIPDPNNCKKYYVCSKNKSSFKMKIKTCDSDEVFDKNKEKCVDAESYDCQF